MSAPVLLNASKTGSRAAIDVTKKAENGPAGTHFYTSIDYRSSENVDDGDEHDDGDKSASC